MYYMISLKQLEQCHLYTNKTCYTFHGNSTWNRFQYYIKNKKKFTDTQRYISILAHTHTKKKKRKGKEKKEK
uniref:Uncharacterized protein n=1 Tax=Octopus bimaculoides TaxID=37653 RepID=A0A0L8HGK0_OCTBM